VQPSSLVFLVIIGVWAAYFVQYWVRRREHLATVHAVDQFSESMRVLERQAGDAVADGAAHPSRPQTLLKRTPVVMADVEPPAASAAAAASRPPRTSTAPEPARRSAGRRVRGLAVVATFLAVLMAAPLAVLGFLPTAAALAPVLLLLGALTWARRGVAADRAARQAARPRREQPLPRATSTVARTEVRRAAQPVAEDSVTVQAAVVETPVAGTAPEPAHEQVAEQAQPVAVRDELYDLRRVEESDARSAAAAVVEHEPLRMHPIVDEDDIPLTWDPVPVPRPTYAMKSRVTRPAPTAADLVGDADTEYAAYEDDEPARRVAGA
jgi:hypothetical protein